MSDKECKIRSCLITDRNCPVCPEVIKLLDSEIKSGKVKVVDISSSEGKEITKGVLVTRVPSIVSQIKIDGKWETYAPNDMEDIRSMLSSARKKGSG